MLLMGSGLARAAQDPALRATEQNAAQLATRASEGVTAAFDRAMSSLVVLLADASPSTKLKLQVFRDGPSLRIYNLRGPRALPVDQLVWDRLKEHGRLVRFYQRPQPNFLVAVAPKGDALRAAALQVPLDSLVSALATIPLPSGTRLEVVSRSGDLLSHPERPLTAQEQAASRTIAGRKSRVQTVPSSTLAYSPIGNTGAGILVVVPLGSAATLSVTAPVATDTAASTVSEAPATAGMGESPSPMASPTPAPVIETPASNRIWFYVAALGFILISMLTLFVIWWRNRTLESEAEPLERSASSFFDGPHGSSLEEVARLVSGVSAGLPALREALGTASRSLDRAYSKGANEPRLIREAKDLAQDLTEQASGLHERLLQASKAPSEAKADPQEWLNVSNQITQLALDLALAAAQPDRLDAIVKGVNQLRELASELARRGVTATRAEAPSLPYLVELSGALRGRCERLEAALGAVEIDEQLASQLQLALVALDRGVAQIGMLSERARALEKSFPPEGSSR